MQLLNQDLQTPGTCSGCRLLHMAVYCDGSERCADAVVAQRKSSRTLPARHVIIREGAVSDEIYQLFDGWAFRYKSTRDGRRQILSFLLPGDLIEIPLLHGERLSHAVKSLTPVSLCVFGRQDFADFVVSEQTRLRNARATTAKLHEETRENLSALARGTGAQRIASLVTRLVLKLHSRGFATGPLYPFPLTRVHIADATGLTPAHVSRTLAQMHKANLLGAARGWMMVPDLDALKRV